MGAVRHHFAQHPTHMLGCGIAALFVVAAMVFGLPVLAVFGAVFCGVMMIGMVWMMVAMAAKARH